MPRDAKGHNGGRKENNRSDEKMPLRSTAAGIVSYRRMFYLTEPLQEDFTWPPK